MERKKNEKMNEGVPQVIGPNVTEDGRIEFYSPTQKFKSGSMYISSMAITRLNPDDVGDAVERHFNGDWGMVCESDAEANEMSLLHGLRILSIYEDCDGIRFWIITEADRSATTVLLPSDY